MNSILNPKSAVGNLLMANVIIFLAQTLLLKVNFFQFALHDVGSGFQLWQLVSYMFLHGGFMHLFFNMFALWMFGRQIEYDLGTKRFIVYYFACGIGAGVINLIVNSLMGTPGLTVGASGAVFGILLAFGMLHPNDRIMLLIPPIPIKAKWFVIIYGGIELLEGVRAADNVAHFAHLGGMIFGAALLLWWKKQRRIYF